MRRAAELPLSAVLLAGGRGRRMGGSKLFLALPENALFERVLRAVSMFARRMLVVVAPDEEGRVRELLGGLLRRFGAEVIPDPVAGEGPLVGLAAALRVLSKRHPGDPSRTWAFVVGCDMPEISEAVVRLMWSRCPAECDVVVARLGGYLEPLHAFYSTSCLSAAHAAVARGARKITSFYRDVRLAVVEEEELRLLPGYARSFRNVNTPEELEDWKRERQLRP